MYMGRRTWKLFYPFYLAHVQRYTEDYIFKVYMAELTRASLKSDTLPHYVDLIKGESTMPDDPRDAEQIKTDFKTRLNALAAEGGSNGDNRI